MSDFILPSEGPLAKESREPPRPAPLDAVCDAAVAVLKAELPGNVFIDHFPDKPDQFDFEGHGAAALVLFGGSRFTGDGLRGFGAFNEALRLVVVLLVRSLRGPSGAYELINITRRALTGASLAGSQAAFPVEIDLESEHEQVFQYRLVFETGLVSAPASLKRPRPVFGGE